jgi:hypothetical protein
LIAATGALAFSQPAEAANRQDRVAVIATPEGGIQPRAVADNAGVIPLISFKGDPGDGDLFSVRSKPGTTEFSKPILVNSQPGSAAEHRLASISTVRVLANKNQRMPNQLCFARAFREASGESRGLIGRAGDYPPSRTDELEVQVLTAGTRRKNKEESPRWRRRSRKISHREG